MKINKREIIFLVCFLSLNILFVYSAVKITKANIEKKYIELKMENK